MRVTAKIVSRFEDKGRLKAIATVCLEERFLVTGVRVTDCERGLMVFMPSRKTGTGEYKDICFPITPELHQQIKTVVLDAYQAAQEQENGEKETNG